MIGNGAEKFGPYISTLFDHAQSSLHVAVLDEVNSSSPAEATLTKYFSGTSLTGTEEVVTYSALRLVLCYDEVTSSSETACLVTFEKVASTSALSSDLCSDEATSSSASTSLLIIEEVTSTSASPTVFHFDKLTSSPESSC